MSGESEAMKRMVRGRSGLILLQPFFGTLALNLQLVESRDIETLATDGRRLLFNPDYVTGLTDAEIEFGIAHEVEHCALKHCTRRGNRDHRLWNIACDHPVNLDLKRAGFTMPRDWYCDEQYAGLSADAVYRLLQQKEEEHQSEPDPNSAGGDAEDDQDDGASNGDPDSQSASSGSGDSAEDGGGEQGSETRDDQAGGDGEPDTDTGAASTGGKQVLSVGGIGEVLDAAPDDPGQAGEIEAEWEIVTRQAIGVAKAHAAGRLPGHVAELVEKLDKPTTDWRDVFRRFVTPSSTERSTWSRPSRRFAGSGLFLPGKVSDGVNHIAWIIDTSGSMNRRALSACRSELQAALDEGAVDRLIVVCCDTAVRGFETFERGDELKFTAFGRGGTRFAPAIAWVLEHHPDVAGMIYFTDLESDDFGPDPSIPLLWAAYGDPRELGRLYANAPFGEFLEIEY